MYLARITFGLAAGPPRRLAELNYRAQIYLGALAHNGQIGDEFLTGWVSRSLMAYASLPRPDSLARRHHSAWGLAALEPVEHGFGRPPTWEMIEDGVPKRFRSWKRSPGLFLCTESGDCAGPVWCMETAEPIPVYLLPVDPDIRERLYFWARYYSDLDRVWLASRELEMPAYRQLADPASDLSAGGREIAAEIERATGKPTYYYMMRYHGRRTGEDDRPCPICGGVWRVPRDAIAARRFDFRCDRCRLVSHSGPDVDHRRARIGEFRPAGNPRPGPT